MQDVGRRHWVVVLVEFLPVNSGQGIETDDVVSWGVAQSSSAQAQLGSQRLDGTVALVDPLMELGDVWRNRRGVLSCVLLSGESLVIVKARSHSLLFRSRATFEIPRFGWAGSTFWLRPLCPPTLFSPGRLPPLKSSSSSGLMGGRMKRSSSKHSLRLSRLRCSATLCDDLRVSGGAAARTGLCSALGSAVRGPLPGMAVLELASKAMA